MQGHATKLYLRVIAMILTIAILNSCTELPLFAAIGYALDHETVATAEETSSEEEDSAEKPALPSDNTEESAETGGSDTEQPGTEDVPISDETGEKTDDPDGETDAPKEDASPEPDEEDGLDALDAPVLAASTPYTIESDDMSAYNTYTMADAVSYAVSHSADSRYILMLNTTITDTSAVTIPEGKTVRLIINPGMILSGIPITVEGTLELMGTSTGAQGYVNLKDANITVAPGGTLLWEGGFMSAIGFQDSKLTIAAKTTTKPAGYACLGAADSSSYLSFVDSPIINYGKLDILGNPSKSDAVIAMINKSGTGTITNYGTLNFGNARADVVDQFDGTLTVSFREQFGAQSPWIGTLNMNDGNTIIEDGVFGTLTGSHGTRASAARGAFKGDCSHLLALKDGFGLYFVDGYYRILENNILAQKPDGTQGSFPYLDAAADYLLETGGTITLSKNYQTTARGNFKVSSGKTVTLDAGSHTMVLSNMVFQIDGTLTLQGSSSISSGTFNGNGKVIIESGVYSTMNFQVPTSITGGTFEDAPALCPGSSITGGRFKVIDGLDAYLGTDEVFLKESDGYYHIYQTTPNYKVTLAEKTFYAATIAEAIDFAGKMSPEAIELGLELMVNLEETEILIPKGCTIHLNLKDKVLYGSTFRVEGILELTAEQTGPAQNLNYDNLLISGSMTLNAASGSIGTAVNANTEVIANGSLTLTGIAAHSIQLGYLVNNGTMVIGQAEVHPGRKAISIETLENYGSLVLFDSYVKKLLLMNGSDTEIRMPAAYTPNEACRVDSVDFQTGSLKIYGGDFGPITYGTGVSFACYGGTFENDPSSHLTQDSLPVFYDGSRYIVADPFGSVDTSNGTSHPFDTLEAAAAVINSTPGSQYILHFRKSGSVNGNAVINKGKQVSVEMPQNAVLDFSGSLTVNGSIEFGSEIGTLKNLILGGSGTAAILGGAWQDLEIQSSSLLVSITDGTFDGTLTVAEDAQLTISGGRFARIDGLNRYLADSKRFRKESDGYYHLVDFHKNILVNAENRAWYYENLADAAADALANGWENPVFTLAETYMETTNPTFPPALKSAVLELGSFLILGDFTLTSECPLEIRGSHMPNGTVVVKDGLTVSPNLAGIRNLVLERGSGYHLTGDFSVEKLTVGAWVVESEISGGTYNDCIFLSKPEGLTITGGSFNTDPTDHCTIPKNKHFVKNGAYYELVVHERLRTVIGGQTQTFLTLEDAMAAIAADTAADAHTLTVLDDYTVDEAVTIPASEHLTYNQNGFTTTAAAALFVVEGSLEITGDGTMYTAGEDGILLDVSGSLKLTDSGMLNGGIVLEDNASIHTAKDADFEINCPGYALTVKGNLSASEIQGGTFVGGRGPISLAQRNENLVIRGGLFSKDITELLPDGYHAVKTQQSPDRWQVRYEPVVIAETGKRYVDLKSALAELADSQTIRLLDSLTLGWGEGDFRFGAEISSMMLDLNGKTITGALSFQGADVTLKNGTVTPASGAAVTARGVNLTMEKVHSDASKLVSFYGNVGGSVNTLTLAECTGVSLDVQSGHVDIASGSYSGDIRLTLAGSVSVTGGHFGGDVLLNEAIVSGGEFAGKVSFTGVSTVSGGSFRGSLEPSEQLTLAGGRYYFGAHYRWTTFRNSFADGYHPQLNRDSETAWWEIVNTPMAGKAQITKQDGTLIPCDSLTMALSMADDGETVALLEDGEIFGDLWISQKNLTLDLGGFTLTATGAAPVLTVGPQLTGISIQNGTIKAAQAESVVQILRLAEVSLNLNIESSTVAVFNYDGILYFQGGSYHGTQSALVSSGGEITSKASDAKPARINLISISDFACFANKRKDAYSSVGLTYDESNTHWVMNGKEMKEDEIKSLLNAYLPYMQAALRRNADSSRGLCGTVFTSEQDTIRLTGGLLTLNSALVTGNNCITYRVNEEVFANPSAQVTIIQSLLNGNHSILQAFGNDSVFQFLNSVLQSQEHGFVFQGDGNRLHIEGSDVSGGTNSLIDSHGVDNKVNFNKSNLDTTLDKQFTTGGSEVNIKDSISLINNITQGAGVGVIGGSLGALGFLLSGALGSCSSGELFGLGALALILFSSMLINGRNKDDDDPDNDRFHYQVQMEGRLPVGFEFLSEALTYAATGDYAIVYLTEASWSEKGGAVNLPNATTFLRLNGGTLTLESGSIVNNGRLIVEGAGTYIAQNGPVFISRSLLRAENDQAGGGIVIPDVLGDDIGLYDFVVRRHLGIAPKIMTFKTAFFCCQVGCKAKYEDCEAYGVYLEYNGDALITGGHFNKINYIQSETVEAGCSVFQMQGSVLRITGGVFDGALDFSGFPMIINYLIHPRNALDYVGGNTYIGGGEFHGVVNGVILNRQIVENSSESNILVAIKDGLKSAFIDHEPIQEVVDGHVKLGTGSYFNGIVLAPRIQVDCDGTKFGPGTYLLSGYFEGAIAPWQGTGYAPLFFLPYDILDCLDNPISYSPKTNDHPEGLIFHRSPGVATIFSDVSFRESLIAAMNLPSLPAFFPSDNNWDVYTQYVLDTLTLTRNYYPDPIPLNMRILQINEHLLVHLQLQHGEEVINPLNCKEYDDFMADFKQLILHSDTQLEQIASIIAKHVQSGKWVWKEAKDSPFSDCYSVSTGGYGGTITDHHEAATELLATLPYKAAATNKVTLAAKGTLPDGSRFVRWTTNYGVECFQDATTYDAKNDIYYVEYTPERQNTGSEHTQDNEFIAVYELPTAKIEREKTAYYYSLEDALKDMKAGEQVILLRDVTLKESVTLNTNGFIRLNEHTVTVEAISSVGVQVNADITLIGDVDNPGGLLAPENSSLGTLIAVGRRGKLKLSNAKLDASHISSAVTVQGGTVTVPLGAHTYVSGRDEDIRTETGSVALSGGYYHHPVPESFCAPGYEPKAEPVQGWYTVTKMTHHPLALYSALNTGESYSLARLEGGGRYAEGEQVTIKAGNVMGMRFTGWYECTVTTNYLGERRIIPGTLVSANAETTVTMSGALWNLVAVYERVSTGLINLTVITQGTDTAGTVTVNGALQEEDQQIYSFPLGTVITLTTTAPTFKAWLGSSNHIVSTQKAYHFTLVSDAVITMDANSGTETLFGYAYVEFVSGYGQIMQSERWDYMGKDYQLPPVPDKLGGLNGRWSVDGKTAATVEDILNTVIAAELHYIQVKPIYDRAEETHTITVYEDGIQRPEPITLVLGNAVTVTAAQLPGKTFSYWAADPEGTQILGYARGYYLVATKDVTLYAIYDVEAEPEPVMVVSNFYALADEPKLKIETTRTVPSGYEMLEHGILRTREEALGSPEKLLVDVQGVTKHVANTTAPNGAYTLTIKLSELSRNAKYYVRGYLIVRNKTTGEIRTLYSEISTGIYNEMVSQ